MNKSAKQELSEVFFNEVYVYVFYNRYVYERLTKRYKKKYKIDYPLGMTLDDHINIMEKIETACETLLKDLIEIFIADKALSDGFFGYLYNVYCDDHYKNFEIMKGIRNRKHFDE